MRGLGRGVGIAIPFLIIRRITQPEIGVEVYDLPNARQGGDHLLAGLVRQGAEAQVNARNVDLVYRHQIGQIEMAQMRKNLPHPLPGLGIGGKRRDLEVGMGGDQPDKFGTGISGCAKNGDFMGHGDLS